MDVTESGITISQKESHSANALAGIVEIFGNSKGNIY